MYDIREKKEAVKEIQRALRELSGADEAIPPVVADGIYGNETKEGVRLFQKKYGLPETGETDFETWQLLTKKARYAEEERKREYALLPPEVFPMRLGDSGSHIRILQSALGEITDTEIPIDGFFGGKTEETVRAVERRYGLSPTGTVCAGLWHRITGDYTAIIRKKYFR